MLQKIQKYIVHVVGKLSLKLPRTNSLVFEFSRQKITKKTMMFFGQNPDTAQCLKIHQKCLKMIQRQICWQKEMNVYKI